LILGICGNKQYEDKSKCPLKCARAKIVSYWILTHHPVNFEVDKRQDKTLYGDYPWVETFGVITRATASDNPYTIAVILSHGGMIAIVTIEAIAKLLRQKKKSRIGSSICANRLTMV
jgi:peptidoglycan/xylan/chitin deacetylase (PgdA/CDA1 family)